MSPAKRYILVVAILLAVVVIAVCGFNDFSIDDRAPHWLEMGLCLLLLGLVTTAMLLVPTRKR